MYRFLQKNMYYPQISAESFIQKSKRNSALFEQYGWNFAVLNQMLVIEHQHSTFSKTGVLFPPVLCCPETAKLGCIIKLNFAPDFEQNAFWLFVLFTATLSEVYFIYKRFGLFFYLFPAIFLLIILLIETIILVRTQVLIEQIIEKIVRS